MCISDGVLRAKIDGELPSGELESVAEHLAACGKCREREAEIAGRARQAGALLSEMAQSGGADFDAGPALARFHARRPAESQPAWFWRPRAWAGACAVALLALLVFSPPARAFMQQVLGILRVNKVVAVPIERDFAAEGKGELLGQILADTITTTKKGGRLVVADRSAAEQAAGFTVRLPELRRDAPQLAVQTETAFHFTVNSNRLTTLLSALNRPDLPVPAQLDGAQVYVDAPAGVVARYGDCPIEPVWRERRQGQFDTCAIVSQFPAPTVVTVPQLDLRSVAEFGLQITGMSADEARAFSQTIDWTSTLAIPIPRDAKSYETVAVDGAKGVLVTGVSHPRSTVPPGYGLFWMKNGVVLAIAGFGDSAQAVQLAASLR